ncbi:hypothetical protein QM787_19860 [Rhodococcus ruber]|uniref:Uncharacterized protein n=1 Tax=Rhodococcus ruber TaxID=1830 RepID=A0A098BHN4_9NOCA|nr:hypothetical protein [Rhodococcus ruber]MCZ4504699.1 hypothetical protein [Rhodococcus ruber]MDI9984124.1 hypothetical protein [Rhodococcus ruber]MDI9999619.1 hypothetical protein [Rhodococcus ruber]MDJ0445752.1 hypothetical protein [Rhodococcus ruber]CDZ87236.1 hypothetical protein RHRU231_230064 [Rhodococcus ruber]
MLITVLMIPFQASTPFAPYSPMLILLFFTLQAPPRALLGMLPGLACGVAWGRSVPRREETPCPRYRSDS